jgi:Carboxypeptidase regulatory-like domain
MRIKTGQASAFTVRVDLLFFAIAAIALLPLVAAAQGLTGSLIGKVRDEQGAAIQGATVRLSSPALMGGPATLLTNEEGQLRFPVLPPGLYALEIEMRGFATLHDQDILIAAGATMERTATLKLAGVAESVVVEGTGSRIDAQNPGSERVSVPRTSTRFQRDGRACSISSGPLPACRRPRHQAVSRRRSPRSAPAPTKISFSSTA